MRTDPDGWAAGPLSTLAPQIRAGGAVGAPAGGGVVVGWVVVVEAAVVDVVAALVVVVAPIVVVVVGRAGFLAAEAGDTSNPGRTKASPVPMVSDSHRHCRRGWSWSARRE
jgi:hypothetical protein